MTDIERTLVTGGAGFVGSHAAEYYAQRGVKVTALDDLSRAETLDTADELESTAKHNWRYLEQLSNVDRVEGDVRDRSTVSDLIDGVDAVVHTAGQVAVTASLEDPYHDLDVNTRGTLTVLEAASHADSDPAVVFASTNKVYGDNVNEIPTTETETRYRYDDPEYQDGVPETLSVDQTEHTPYGVSKLAGDLYVQDYAAREAVDAAAFRMSCIYGPRQFGNEDQGWVAHFLLSALRENPITIFGDGKQVRDVLYVDDLVRAYDAYLSDPAGKPSVYNVGGGPEYTTSLVEFLDVIESKVGCPPVSYDEWREGDQRVYVSDITRARQHLDWEPEVSVEEGVDRFLEWYRGE